MRQQREGKGIQKRLDPLPSPPPDLIRGRLAGDDNGGLRKWKSGRRFAASIPFAFAFAALIPAVAAEDVPNFAPDNSTAWIALAQEFVPPPSGPGPITTDPAHSRTPNGQPTFRVADLSNPILQPWAREALRKANERALSGRAAYTPKERCWPIGVPGFLLYPVFPV